MTRSVLLVDDEKAMCEMVAAALGRRDFDVHWSTSPQEGLDSLAQNDFGAVVTDINMPGVSGIDLCARIVENRPDLPVIVLTSFGSFETAVAAIRAGAYDFLTKPVEIETLVLALERAFNYRVLREEVRRLRQTVRDLQSFGALVGESAAMKRLYEMLGRVAETDASVLVTGESGTGKELVAQALHDRGRRQRGPFVAVNCAAMPETLLESELFGHARGAFTDAKVGRTGLFVQASGGTLFLDEIGELPLGLQPKLLRALQQRTVRPVGSDTEVPFDVRLVAATNVDLEAAVEAGRFREDLFFRIHVISVEVPPLRMRGNDVLLLAQRFVEEFAKHNDKRVSAITSAAAEKLLAYGWPGNVRELRNCIERAVALTQYEQITVEDLPEKLRAAKRGQMVVVSDDATDVVPLEEVERRYILRVLDAAGGNKASAARLLGLDRKTLYRKLERWGEAADDGRTDPAK
jgi:DNA-binding NtrC family response regulator